MDTSPAAAVESSAAADTQLPETSRVRRRMVQSTLMPHKPSKIEEDCDGEDKYGDDDECCGSQGSKKRARKRKGSAQVKTPRVSKTKKQAMEAFPEANSEKDATPKKPTPKSASRRNSTPRKNATPKKNTTPKKNGRTNGKIAADSVENGDAPPQIPNLRLEAKLMAEENSRVFGGKQIHPFFQIKNSSSRCDDKTIQRKAKSNTLGPIHVFESEQDDAVSLDWRNWKFNEEPFKKSIHTKGSAFSSIFECSVKALEFDQFPQLLRCSGTSLVADNMSLDESQQKYLHEASAAAVLSNVPEECCRFVVDANADCQVNELVPGIIRKSDEHQGQPLQERFMSSHSACSNQFDNRLWTDKYQPKMATEICGNDDSVRVLTEWLQTWSQKADKDPSECNGQDPNFEWGSDSENISKETTMKNVLLVTGPVGSGKSAAVYACAKEQGFRVLEASASECRNGAALRDRFGVLESQATLDSQLVQWSQESSIEFQSMDVTESVGVLSDGKILRQLGSEAAKAILISDEDNCFGATETTDKLVSKDNSVVCSQGQKPLFLFEDVDVVFLEDRGFVSAIQQIAAKVKWPVILTSNSEKPPVPDSLDRREVSFKMPLREELLQKINMVCAAEKVNVQPHLVEQLIESCEKDIRKTIMHLQFWCQTEQSRKGKVKQLSTLPPFDLEAGYQILPKMIPWDFPSQLSDLVEKEITMSLCKMENNSIFKAVTEDKFDCDMMQQNVKKRIYDTSSIEAKKKAMLSKNCSENDCMDFVGLYDRTCDLFDLSSSPLPYSKKSNRRKCIVMSSDSEDEFPEDRVLATPDRNARKKLFLEVDDGFPSPHPCENKILSSSTELALSCGIEKQEENLYQCSEAATFSLQKSLNQLTDLQLCAGSDKLEKSIIQFSEATFDLNVKDACESLDVSCVPESSFVPETIIDDVTKVVFGRVPYGQAGQGSVIVEEASVSNEFRQYFFPIKADDYDEPTAEFCKDYELIGGIHDINSVLPRVEAEDSQYELGQSFMGEPQLMDESSCIDFNRKFKLQENSSPLKIVDTVQESWRRLRNQHADLKQLVASEYKSSSQIIQLSGGISHLISEAELLHAKCQSLDPLGLPVVASEESNALSWCDEQLQMASSILQHGFCLYAKDIASVGSNISSDSSIDLISDVLSAAGKTKISGSLGPNRDSKASNVGLSENGLLLNSENELNFASIIRSMVPSRAYKSIKGYALCEYLSSLGQISRSESSRLSDGVDTSRRRRGRAARNYLSTGSLMLSPKEISLLGQSNIYGKFTSQSIDKSVDRNS
ncbi:P-loop containing nucleoside triphosphate hydrolases superfamily protein [Euphorbia peplus]|nr:P-loop containing nucleoside triphosphate hydrolases superfamily protein [Euphorbia peplus]